MPTDHILSTEQFVPRPRQEVFDFFADAENLERITPSALRFEIASPLPIAMAEGTLIDYRLRLFGVPFKWKTRITTWEPGVRFVDEQLKGPYAKWVHTHSFRDAEGGTVVSDHVRYQLPFYPVGQMAYPIVRRQLKAIFDFRSRRIRELVVGQ